MTRSLKSGAKNPEAIETQPPRTITFGSFCLDLRRSSLLHGSEPVRLRPKTWAVLVYLAERPGALVTQEALLEAVWPEVEVTPQTLNKSIGELRDALGDTHQSPRFIETVHRRGFRFIAAISAEPPVRSEHVPVGSAPTTGDQPRDTSPLVGRDDELRRLAALLARASAGHRQMTFITGPAGVGKTSLVDAFAGMRNTSAPVWVARAACVEQLSPREPYLPVLTALERLARRPDSARLLELLRRIAPTWLVQMPWLVGDHEADALRRSLQMLGAERMLREMAVLVEALTEDLTLVLVFDDLHWSDTATVDLLSLLAERREPARLLVIGTYRPAEAAAHEHVLHAAARSLRLRRQCVEIPLHDLSATEVQRYLELRFARSDFAPVLAPLVHVHTGGQPLFVVATVDHMLAEGWIVDTEPGWALTARAESMDLGVPDDVRRMIETELHRLSPGERHLLEAASVGGREFAVPLVAAALESEIGDVELRCEALARGRGFLRAAGSQEWPDGSVASRYKFTHDLYRQVVYDEIPDGRRARLHRRVGLALETAHAPSETESGAMATHFERGLDASRASRYLVAAGAAARRRFADREAIGYFDAALGQIALLSDADEARRRELDVRLALGVSLAAVHGYASEKVSANYERASQLCAEVGSVSQLFETQYVRWLRHALRAEGVETTAMLTEMERVAHVVGTPALVVLSSAAVRTALYQGRFADSGPAMDLLLTRVRDCERSGAPAKHVVDPVVVATVHHAVSLWFLGDLTGAEASARTGLEQARVSGDLLTLCPALMLSALVALLGRRAEEGGRLAEELVALSGEHGLAFWRATAEGLHGRARIERGEIAEGSASVNRAITSVQATGAGLFLVYLYGFLAEGLLRNRAFVRGMAAADTGLVLAENGSDRAYAPEVWRLKGELLLAAGSAPSREHSAKRVRKAPTPAASATWQQAEHCFQRALDLARAAEARSLELRAATSLARAWLALGRGAEGHAMLAEVCAWFGSADDSPDIVDARALLTQSAR